MLFLNKRHLPAISTVHSVRRSWRKDLCMSSFMKGPILSCSTYQRPYPNIWFSEVLWHGRDMQYCGNVPSLQHHKCEATVFLSIFNFKWKCQNLCSDVPEHRSKIRPFSPQAYSSVQSNDGWSIPQLLSLPFFLIPQIPSFKYCLFVSTLLGKRCVSFTTTSVKKWFLIIRKSSLL